LFRLLPNLIRPFKSLSIFAQTKDRVEFIDTYKKWKEYKNMY
jgi:hypothetical protein